MRVSEALKHRTDSLLKEQATCRRLPFGYIRMRSGAVTDCITTFSCRKVFLAESLLGCKRFVGSKATVPGNHLAELPRSSDALDSVVARNLPAHLQSPVAVQRTLQAHGIPLFDAAVPGLP